MIKLPFDLKNIDLKNIDLKKNPEQTLIAAILICLILLVIYCYISVFPQIGRLTDVLSRMGKAMGQLKSAEYDISRIGELQNNIDANRSKVELYEKRLPAEQEIPALLESLSKMAKASNITIAGITPVPVSQKDQKGRKNVIYQEFPILISAKCGYHELGRFLANMENADRFMKVVDIDVKANKASPKKHDVELLVLTYVLLDNKMGAR
jgi:type IV pilus assembly protein PilO